MSRDDFTSYLLLGCGALVFVQFVINVGMNLGLLPVTGIGLPFVSYGGSAILMASAVLGMLQSIAVRTKKA